jgi:phosphoribosyl 1,2-cyclic phosphodiesterase
MSLYIASICSGSNGNCYYVGNNNEGVLVDAGISCREIEKRIERLKLSLKKIKAIFITHEHSDHIRGVEVLSKKYNLPVYITQKTLRSSKLIIAENLLRSFDPYNPVAIGNLFVTAFPKMHDAADPHSFIVSGSNINIGVLTDIGKPCSHVLAAFEQCDAIFLEANYDEEILEDGPYPYYLKRRISSDQGHLSNKQALDLFLNYKSNVLQHLILCHLSKENNNPALVKSLFEENAMGVKVIVASRECESELVFIQSQVATTELLYEKNLNLQ